ncbi:unnamed protein product [Caenorhabditis angaria]|uniref:BTB domain-containing protein n=1 Tax=Caenorhabditis angaria TaxID=860376 RepID=A0A9P1I7J9_9PELO|nr:unnamed protein product [Caenorhabditis angaria]
MEPIIVLGNDFKWRFNANEVANLRRMQFSEKFTIAEKDWKIGVVSIANELTVEIHLETNDQIEKQKYHLQKSAPICFTANDCSGIFAKFENFYSDGREGPLIVDVLFNLKIYDFSKEIPNNLDFVLHVDDQRLHVNKGVLCSVSQFFSKFFESNPEEKRFEVENVELHQMCHFLAAINPIPIHATKKSYEFLMVLAKKFECLTVFAKCEQYLIIDNDLDLMKKLELADQNDFEYLLESCIDSFKTHKQVKEITLNADFWKFKESTQLRVVKSILKFL